MESTKSSLQATGLLKQAVSWQQLGKLFEALKVYEHLLRIDPNNFDAHFNRGNLFKELRRYDEALASYDEALHIAKDNAEAHNNRGIVLKELRRYEDALSSCARAIVLKPDFAEAYCNRGNILGSLGCYDDALLAYDQTISLRPDYAEAYYKRGLVLHHQKEYEAASASYDRAISLRPDYAEAYFKRGLVLYHQKEYEAASASYNRAISLRPDYTEAHNNLGDLLTATGRYEEALGCFLKAISLNPASVHAFNNLGTTYSKMGRMEEALAGFDRAIALDPNCVEAYNNRGVSLRIMRRYEDSLDDFNKAFSIDANNPYVYGNLFSAQMQVGLWDDYERNVEALVKRIEYGVLASSPFIFLHVPTSPDILQVCASRYVVEKYMPAHPAHWPREHYAHDRIRIGYFSSDFYDHATAYLIAELIEKHDRSRFEVFGFSFGPEKIDDMRIRLQGAFDQFFEVSNKSDQDIAALARKLEIDIAVDLKGFTDGARTGIFTLRPAPIQVNYLGYPGTMGAPFVDFIIADSIVIPKEHFAYYTEKIVHLPHSYQVNDSQRRIADSIPTRSALGLPEAGFVFCCFNNNLKLTPDLFSIWMRLLDKVSNSVLWLYAGSTAIQQNLRREAQKRSVDPARLVFAPPMELKEHLARHRQADLFLDTFYYNAHTTASDALWAGLPVLTCLGNTFAGRVAASLLYAVGLSELVTHSHEEYESLALYLATNPDVLDGIKRKLAENRASYPLFNIDLFIQSIESAYTVMWRNSLQGLAPDHIYI